MLEFGRVRIFCWNEVIGDYDDFRGIEDMIRFYLFYLVKCD